MTTSEYFGGWMKVLPINELFMVVNLVNRNYSHGSYTPEYKDIFRAFELCPFEKCRVVMLGQDPYPQKGVATGILFGNRKETKVVSPSLRVVMESVNPEGNDFDITLESWAKQGILMINSSLTCEINKVGSNFLLWKPFISKFLVNLSAERDDIVYVMFGRQAESFISYLSQGVILSEKHPAYYARYNTRMPSRIFDEVNKHVIGEKIQWCK